MSSNKNKANAVELKQQIEMHEQSVRDTHQGAVVNVVKASDTDSTFRTMAVKLESAF